MLKSSKDNPVCLSSDTRADEIYFSSTAKPTRNIQRKSVKEKKPDLEKIKADSFASHAQSSRAQVFQNALTPKYLFLRKVLITQVLQTLAIPKNASGEMIALWQTAACEALDAIQPRDEIECMFATQIVTAQFASMALMCKGLGAEIMHIEQIRFFLNAADKCTARFSEQLASLEKYRLNKKREATLTAHSKNPGSEASAGASSTALKPEASQGSSKSRKALERQHCEMANQDQLEAYRRAGQAMKGKGKPLPGVTQ